MPSIRFLSALLDFKLAEDYALMHVCHVVESRFFFVWTILSQLITPTTMVTYDAGLISFYFCACEETKVVKAGFFFHFSSHSQEDRNSNII